MRRIIQTRKVDGVKPHTFRGKIRYWSKLVDFHGEEILKHKEQDKKWTAEEKFKLVSKVLAGNSYEKTALKAGINSDMLYKWVNKYKKFGYNSLEIKKRGRQLRMEILI